ncbi:MBL fold metallo-hydrolase [Flavobacterium sp. 3HN19-14]|uniref:MBL fold metallo-hydrolase n=1 Tax=Flavobacterium sp. 3HN19-14 TaxID=3448133 RepID=UPI003EE297DC
MKIQKLNWAGIKLACGRKTILIDAVEDFKPYFAVLGDPKTPVIRFADTTQADYILFTHLHLDHLDIGVIDKCLKPDGKIIGYKKLEKSIAKFNRPVVYLDNDETFRDNDIVIKSVFSLDGIGEQQTAWIVAYKNTKIFHGGDTIWHNQFWKLGRENPDIDFAFLPINGAIVNFGIIGLEYSTIPASLTLEEAFNAAKLLHAKALVPIHYGKFSTPFYQPKEVDDEDFIVMAKNIKQPYLILEDGKFINKQKGNDAIQFS